MTPVQGLGAGVAAYLTITAILVVTPGSTTAVVVRNTLEGGRRAGLATALGVALANTTHATLAGVGLSVLITTFPRIVDIVRVIGAAYLAWLGIVSLRRAWLQADGGLRFDARPDAAHAAPADRPAGVAPEEYVVAPEEYVGHHFSGADRRSFGDGVAINMLNPAIISFYVAVVPSFIPSGASHWYFVWLAAAHVGMALVCHSAWASALDAVRHWFAPPGARRALEGATGVALVGLAARVLWF